MCCQMAEVVRSQAALQHALATLSDVVRTVRPYTHWNSFDSDVVLTDTNADSMQAEAI